jgi:hypothetical protein
MVKINHEFLYSNLDSQIVQSIAIKKLPDVRTKHNVFIILLC